MEQANLYNEINPSGPTLEEAVEDPKEARLFVRPLTIYRCVSDIGGDTLESALHSARAQDT